MVKLFAIALQRIKAFKHINAACWCFVGWVCLFFFNPLTLVQITFTIVVGLACCLPAYLECPETGAFFQPCVSTDYTAAVF